MSKIYETELTGMEVIGGYKVLGEDADGNEICEDADGNQVTLDEALGNVSLDEERMIEEVNVNLSQWQASSGKTKPSGNGMWWFQIGKEEVSFGGLYSQAKKEAVGYAKKRGIPKIDLLQ